MWRNSIGVLTDRYHESMRIFTYIAITFLALVMLPTPARAHTITHRQCYQYGVMQQFVTNGRVNRYDAARACRKRAYAHFLTHGLPLPALLYRIRQCESGGNYLARNAHSTASGAFQYLDSTWSNHLGYSRAWLAPRRIQDARAIRDFNTYGTTPWAASRGCWG